MNVNPWRILRISGLFLVPALSIFLAILFLRETRAAHWNVEYEANNAVSQYTREADIDIKRRCGLLSGDERTDCRESIERSERQQSGSEYELAAQREQALWDAAMGEAALIGVPFSVFTLLLIFFTYSEQRESNEIATRQFWLARRDADASARATERQFRHSDITARARLRCYLSSTAERYAADDAGTTITLTFSFKNVGLTPAHDLNYSSLAMFAPAPGSGLKPRKLGDHTTPYGLVGPTAETTLVADLQIAVPERDVVNAGKGIVSITTTISYRDEFGDRWQYTQVMQVDENSPKTGLMYTDSCSTQKLSEAEAEAEADDKLDLEGGKEGAEEA